MSKTHYVIAECVDHRDGKRYFPGDTFPNPDDDQATRLSGAGCLSTDKPKNAPAPPPSPAGSPASATDELDAISNPMKLKGIAKAEEIDLGTARSAADIRLAIRAARSVKAG